VVPTTLPPAFQDIDRATILRIDNTNLENSQCSFPELEELPPRRRMLRFLELGFQYRKSTPDELAKELGYANVSIVKQWMSGSAKVPLKQLSSIANHFDCDVADVLQCWLAQELPDDPQMMATANRILGGWEWLLDRGSA
jgi:DNA-binding Xre family transcriptional regulator